MTPAKPIPRSVVAPLTKTRWAHDRWSLTKFRNLLQYHADADRRDGLTCAYFLTDSAGDLLTRAELSAIIRDGAVQPEMYNGAAVTQHWLHSLEQFYAEVTLAWQQHCRRTDELLGTPAGRIAR